MMKKSPATKVVPHREISDESLASLSYSPADDIYNQAKEDQDRDPENITSVKSPNEIDDDEEMNEGDFEKNKSGRDLDVPSSELDDTLEDNGSEDEENNSYSIGGDRHDDLEEDKGE
jgi:hypothetical protein